MSTRSSPKSWATPTSANISSDQAPPRRHFPASFAELHLTPPHRRCEEWRHGRHRVAHETGTETVMGDEEGAEHGELAITRTGDKLRLAREAAGLTLADVASRPRITPRQLDALEHADLSALPGPAYDPGVPRHLYRAFEQP